MRTFGVEEELLLVGAATRQPMPSGELIVNSLDERYRLSRGHRVRTTRGTGRPHAGAPKHALVTELQQEQLEIVGPPQSTLAGQLESIRTGRAVAEAAAGKFDARVVALATPVWPKLPHLAPDVRHRRIGQRFGAVATDQLTCGFHVHVEVESREEGVEVLDRIRVWLPVLLAMSANSPFWYGRDSGFSSFRYQAWLRWPTAGPCDLIGSVEEYDRRAEALVRSGAALDEGMLYFDARLSSHFSTVEVRIADVCLDARHAAVIAALVRALVETAARQWRAGVPAPAVATSEVRAAAWLASLEGLEGGLVDPTGGHRRAAGDVVVALLELVRPVLTEYGEEELIEDALYQLLRDGTGCRMQRMAFAPRQALRDVVDAALHLTHQAAELSPRASPEAQDVSV